MNDGYIIDALVNAGWTHNVDKNTLLHPAGHELTWGAAFDAIGAYLGSGQSPKQAVKSLEAILGAKQAASPFGKATVTAVDKQAKTITIDQAAKAWDAWVAWEPPPPIPKPPKPYGIPMSGSDLDKMFYKIYSLADIAGFWVETTPKKGLTAKESDPIEPPWCACGHPATHSWSKPGTDEWGLCCKQDLAKYLPSDKLEAWSSPLVGME